MRRATKLAPLALAVPLAMSLSGTALAASGTVMGNLNPLNNSGANGTGWVIVKGQQITVKIQASGLLNGMPHAQHIHFGPEARHECPSMSFDPNGDGRLATSEAAGDYGPITVSLTTSGDTSAKSGLAVDRFPTDGTENYDRTTTVSAELAQHILAGDAVLVVHGVDENGDGKYDGKAKSDLDPSLPAEATDPALCARLVAAPSGGAQTGGGGSAGGSDLAVVALGGGLIAAAAGAGTVAVRRSRA